MGSAFATPSIRYSNTTTSSSEEISIGRFIFFEGFVEGDQIDFCRSALKLAILFVSNTAESLASSAPLMCRELRCYKDQCLSLLGTLLRGAKVCQMSFVLSGLEVWDFEENMHLPKFRVCGHVTSIPEFDISGGAKGCALRGRVLVVRLLPSSLGRLILGQFEAKAAHKISCHRSWV